MAGIQSKCIEWSVQWSVQWSVEQVDDQIGLGWTMRPTRYSSRPNQICRSGSGAISQDTWWCPAAAHCPLSLAVRAHRDHTWQWPSEDLWKKWTSLARITLLIQKNPDIKISFNIEITDVPVVKVARGRWICTFLHTLVVPVRGNWITVGWLLC